MKTLAGVNSDKTVTLVTSYWLFERAAYRQLSCMKYKPIPAPVSLLRKEFLLKRQRWKITYSESGLSDLVSFIILSKLFFDLQGNSPPLYLQDNFCRIVGYRTAVHAGILFGLVQDQAGLNHILPPAVGLHIKNS